MKIHMDDHSYRKFSAALVPSDNGHAVADGTFQDDFVVCESIGLLRQRFDESVCWCWLWKQKTLMREMKYTI